MQHYFPELGLGPSKNWPFDAFYSPGGMPLLSFCPEDGAIYNVSASAHQSHYREVPRLESFMEQELRFRLDLGRLALLKKKLG